MATSAVFKDHFNSPRNVGRIENPDAEGSQGQAGRGNYMVLTLRIGTGRIEDIMFETHGCSGAIACGSAITELARGRTLEQAARITRDEVEVFLGGLPLGKGHCADLAVGALRSALRVPGG